jgi:hypothetical protein
MKTKEEIASAWAGIKLEIFTDTKDLKYIHPYITPKQCLRAMEAYKGEAVNELKQGAVSSSAKQNDIKEMILAEYKKGNIVVSTFEGLQVAPLKEIIKQPTDGLLYDLNRNEAVVLTFINDPKWINDYAMVQVVRELKQQLEDKAK